MTFTIWLKMYPVVVIDGHNESLFDYLFYMELSYLIYDHVTTVCTDFDLMY